MGVIARWWDRISGAAERREQRIAYLEALTIVADASRAQSQLLETWVKSFQVPSGAEAQKGWTVTDRDLWLEEQKTEHPEHFVGMPPAIADDPQAQMQWLEDQIGVL